MHELVGRAGRRLVDQPRRAARRWPAAAARRPPRGWSGRRAARAPTSRGTARWRASLGISSPRAASCSTGVVGAGDVTGRAAVLRRPGGPGRSRCSSIARAAGSQSATSRSHDGGVGEQARRRAATSAARSPVDAAAEVGQQLGDPLGTRGAEQLLDGRAEAADGRSRGGRGRVLTTRRSSSSPQTRTRSRAGVRAVGDPVRLGVDDIDGSAGSGRPAAEHHDGVEDDELQPGQLVEGAQHRGADAGPRGELRGVLGCRGRQVRPRREQRGEPRVRPAAELVGQGARGGGGHPHHDSERPATRPDHVNWSGERTPRRRLRPRHDPDRHPSGVRRLPDRAGRGDRGRVRRRGPGGAGSARRST